jgi:hypothetical protein
MSEKCQNRHLPRSILVVRNLQHCIVSFRDDAREICLGPKGAQPNGYFGAKNWGSHQVNIG